MIAPGHGPFVWDPQAKLDEYLAHRLEREQKLLAALEGGARTRDELLDRAWSDVRSTRCRCCGSRRESRSMPTSRSCAPKAGRTTSTSDEVEEFSESGQ